MQTIDFDTMSSSTDSSESQSKTKKPKAIMDQSITSLGTKDSSSSRKRKVNEISGQEAAGSVSGTEHQWNLLQARLHQMGGQGVQATPSQILGIDYNSIDNAQTDYSQERSPENVVFGSEALWAHLRARQQQQQYLTAVGRLQELSKAGVTNANRDTGKIQGNQQHKMLHQTHHQQIQHQQAQLQQMQQRIQLQEIMEHLMQRQKRQHNSPEHAPNSISSGSFLQGSGTAPFTCPGIKLTPSAVGLNDNLTLSNSSSGFPDGSQATFSDINRENLHALLRLDKNQIQVFSVLVNLLNEKASRSRTTTMDQDDTKKSPVISRKGKQENQQLTTADEGSTEQLSNPFNNEPMQEKKALSNSIEGELLQALLQNDLRQAHPFGASNTSIATGQINVDSVFDPFLHIANLVQQSLGPPGLSHQHPLPDHHKIRPNSISDLMNQLGSGGENRNSKPTSALSATSNPENSSHAALLSSSTSISLYRSSDEVNLSKYQIVIRKQLEFFVSSQDDADSNVQGRKKPVKLGQVGMRCRHCASLPLRQRRKGAVYYPSTLSRVYQAAQNMATSHLADSCQAISDDLKQNLRILRDCKDTASAGKRYWADSCQKMGLFEDEDGLRFR